MDEKHTVDERVKDGHGTVGNTSVWVNLLEDCRGALGASSQKLCDKSQQRKLTLVDVGAVGLLAGLGSLLLLARWGGGLLASLFLLSWGLSACWCLSGSGWGLCRSLGSHFYR